MIGFIGSGNMGSAIIKGMLSHGINKNEIMAYSKNISKKESIKNLGIKICSSSKDAAYRSKYLFLAVKPNVYDTVLNEIKDAVSDDSIIISLAAGYEIKKIKSYFKDIKVARIMPNTPALVNAGLTAVCFDDKIKDDEKEYIINLLKTFSEVIITDENHINSYSAVSGSGPAFAFMFIEAMADAAVLLGIPRKDAYNTAAQTLIGSAELLKETNMHPGELKDMVCSPGGATIEGVRTLEEKGFRSAVIECIINTYKRNLNINNIR